jgi:beta-lactamase regulating signal transducer with metallopeptidase domain
MRFLDPLSEIALRIGPLLVDHLWQSTLFAALALGAVLLLRRGPARARHGVWLMVSAKLALPSCALVGLAGAAGIDRAAILSSLGAPPSLGDLSRTIDRVTTPFTGPGASVPGIVPPRDFRAELPALLAIVWAAGCSVVAGSWWRQRQRVSRAAAAGRPIAPGRERAALERARERAGSIGPTPLLVSPIVEQPGVFGVLNPVVLLPQGLADRLSDEELETVLLHELVHVRRRDNLIGHLHMALCCLFWFYPVAWLVDRRLLVERERACDDEVLGLSLAPGVYVSSLLKVYLFCLGPRVAGVSAAGSCLRERLAGIAAHRASSRLNGAHRALVAAAATALLLFLAAGLLGAGPELSLAGNSIAPTPEAPGPESRPAQPPLSAAAQARVDDAPSVAISFDNGAGGPVRIRRATVRIVPLDRPSGSADGSQELVTPPTLDLENTSSRRVGFVRVGFGAEPRFYDMVWFAVEMEAGGSFHLQPDWRTWSNTVPADESGPLMARVVGVRFEDGGTWGSIDDDPARAPAPRSVMSPARPATSYPARFENPAGAPVVVVEARTSAGPLDDEGQSRLPVVTLANTTDRRITHLKLRFKAGTPAHAVTAFAADIAPRGTYTFQSQSTFDGDPLRMHVQVLGVRFDNGDIWGAFDTRIDTRDPTVSVPQYIHRPDPGHDP